MLDQLYTICDNDLYYCILLVYTCVVSFAIGLALGGIGILLM